MYVSHDYKCIDCKNKETRFILKKERDNQYCKKCNQPLLRLPSAPPTTFKFNDK